MPPDPARTHVRVGDGPCAACDDPRMVEYGNGVSQVAGQVAGGSQGGGQTMDVGSSVAQFFTNSAHTLSTLPPAVLVAGCVVIFLGLLMLKRAF